jgi:Domain of unknown function (DUF4338)
MVSMGIEIRYRGKIYEEQDVDAIRELINRNPGQSRYFLSKELCRLWNWTQVNGTPKDMVCRGLMLLLDREGLITLPAKKRELPWLSLKRSAPLSRAVDMTDIAGPLSLLSPLDLAMVRRTPAERLYQSLIRQYHYLGYTQPVGEHLEYIAFSHDRPIACIGFSSAPRHIGARDRYLDWTKEERITNLHKIAVNTRFLILPWIRVPHLASHLLGRTARRISRDWEGLYHHPIVWLETFVDPARGFTGTCYKAAGWRCLGLTTGRGKNDQTGKANRSLKYVFGYPLVRDVKKALYGIL